MKRIVFTMALFVLAAGFVAAQTDLQPIANVKLLKSEPITIKQLKTRVEAFQKEAGRVMTLDERKEVLDSIINERLVVQAAEKDGVKVNDSEVNQYFLQMISQQYGRQITEVEFAQDIKTKHGVTLDEYFKSQQGMSLGEYKAFINNQLVAQRYVLFKKQAELKAMPGPKDAEIRSYYELYKQNFVQPDMVKLFLVVGYKDGAKAKPAPQAKVTELQKMLRDKPSAATEIALRGKAADSGYDSDSIYISKTPQYAQNLGITMEALLKIFDMGINEVSDVTETTADFQCFLIQEKFPAKILGLSDVVQPSSNVTVYEYIKNYMTAQSQQNAVNTALVDIIKELRQPENFQMLKSGAELDKALSW